MLLKTASTALNSKLIASHQDLFAPMIVDAVKSLSADVDGLDDLRGMIGIKRFLVVMSDRVSSSRELRSRRLSPMPGLNR